ncbi:sensor histidine kinase [Actinomadura rupiterrae]|uniref:sensor histidine kinase n=1 Tax=Actinomadura rupiterrae TaxID=559627 RepID=UPI0020A57AB1|nr:sensor histidine kinase [Actinomadura rupiterrae]MCP2341759.1 signal transduction histidine kinase [Actinomadura rupiterrae]
MASTTAWRALTSRRFLLTARPWRALAYLAGGAVTGLLALLVLLPLFVVGTVGSVVLVGIPVLVTLGLCGIPLAVFERRRLALVDGRPARSGHAPPPRPGAWAWAVFRYQEQATWRELAYALLLTTVLWPFDLAVLTTALMFPLAFLSAPYAQSFADPGDDRIQVLKLVPVSSAAQAWALVPVGLLLLPVAGYLLAVAAAARGTVARALLATRETELGVRLAQVTRSRSELVDAFEVERRRIERDLHDGAQQRLVALTMTLGLARISTGDEASALVDQAHRESRLVLDELRRLIRGVHPGVLTDRGLRAAVEDAADCSPVPVEVDLDLPGRLPPAIESTAYFVVSEALANVAKHSGAERATVRGGTAAGVLALEVRDDGRGGADPSAGTGLAGLAARVAAVDGRLSLSSPAQGPTVLRVELPCAPTDLSG